MFSRLYRKIHSKLVGQAAIGFFVLALEQIEAGMQRLTLSLPELPFARPDQLLAAVQGLPGILDAPVIQVPACESEIDPGVFQVGFTLQISAREVSLLESPGGQQLRLQGLLVHRLALL